MNKKINQLVKDFDDNFANLGDNFPIVKSFIFQTVIPDLKKQFIDDLRNIHQDGKDSKAKTIKLILNYKKE